MSTRLCSLCSHTVMPLKSVLYQPDGRTPRMLEELEGKDRAFRQPSKVGPVICRKGHWLEHRQPSTYELPTGFRSFNTLQNFICAENRGFGKIAETCPDYDGEDDATA